jgi:preprotein translocase subunit SecG
MYLFVVVLHIAMCLMLVSIILLQPGKGADGASAFGGGMTSTVFGPRGPTNLLQQATTVIAVMFMVTSVTLAFYSRQSTATEDDGLEKWRQEQLLKKSSGADQAPPSETQDAPVE